MGNGSMGTKIESAAREAYATGRIVSFVHCGFVVYVSPSGRVTGRNMVPADA
jgi:hypothetical protein